MTFTTLDQIVKDFIFRRGYSIHHYIRFMVYAKNVLRETSLDDLKVINTCILKVNDYNAVDLPNDYLDYCSVNIKAGQHLKPLVETDKINSLLNRDSDLNITPYNLTQVADSLTFFGYMYPLYWNMTTWNEYGENTGRLFGLGAGPQDDTFKVVPERNQIQLNEMIQVDNIVLEYISDGMNADAATRITPYAYETISSYILYQLKEHSRTYSESEAQVAKQEYLDQRRILRARLSDLTMEKIKRIVQKSKVASPR